MTLNKSNVNLIFIKAFTIQPSDDHIICGSINLAALFITPFIFCISELSAFSPFSTLPYTSTFADLEKCEALFILHQ